MLKALLNDEAGFVVSTELVLVATILVIGLIVGQTTLRDNVVTELGDTAVAIAAVDQTYQFADIEGHSSSTAGSQFLDDADYCDADNDGVQGTSATIGSCIIISDGSNDQGDSGVYQTAN